MSVRTPCGRALLAAALVWLAITTPAAAQADPAAAYRELLGQYAGGREEEALQRLRELEAALSAAPGLERARGVQIGLVKALPLAVPEALLPVIALHESASLAYQRRSSEGLAAHSRTMMFRLCELFAASSTTADDRRVASDLFASLGGYFHQTSAGSTGLNLFKRSLALDPSNEAALLGAATASEQHGRYDRALGYLERLRRAHPENAEGRLRLAINLGRVGRSGEAIAILEGLPETDAPVWILSLAHQALARLHIDELRMDDAHQALLAGMARIPVDPALAIALAYAAERKAVEGDGSDLFAVLERSARSSGRPPRYRYSRDPVEVFERARTRLRRRAREARPALADALSEPGSSGG